jgi:hypothetical protein
MNLETYATGVIEDSIYGMDTLDLDTLRDSVSDHVASAAENACIYTHNCQDIISRYESEVHDSDIRDVTCDRTFSADEWQDAMVAYANAVAYSWLSNRSHTLLQEIESAADTLAIAAAESGLDAPRVTRDCPHGWAVHESEDSEGVHYWEPAELEGCRAVAVKVSGIWLSYTWTPDRSE